MVGMFINKSDVVISTYDSQSMNFSSELLSPTSSTNITCTKVSVEKCYTVFHSIITAPAFSSTTWIPAISKTDAFFSIGPKIIRSTSSVVTIIGRRTCKRKNIRYKLYHLQLTLRHYKRTHFKFWNAVRAQGRSQPSPCGGACRATFSFGVRFWKWRGHSRENMRIFWN